MKRLFMYDKNLAREVLSQIYHAAEITLEKWE